MKKIGFTLLIFPLLSLTAKAIETTPDYSRFEKQVEIKVSNIITPKVVKFETTEFFGNNTILLDETKKRIPHKWIHHYEKIKKQKNIITETSSVFEGNSRNLVDGNLNSNFAFHPESDNKKTIKLSFSEKTEVSGIFVHVDEGIIAPQKISVRGKFTNDTWTNIVDKVNFHPRIPFPKVSVYGLEISYQTRHFLRLNEIEILGQEEIEKKDELVFFAEEGKTYQLLGNAQFGQKKYYPEIQQPLKTDQKTPIFTLPKIQKNSLFNPDFDKDGINDDIDLCPKTVDPANTDNDKNGRGDFCEDPDLDRINSYTDNCPFKYNPKQIDSDQDEIGDLCDTEEGRWTENQDFLLWIVFIFGAGFLGFLIYRSLKKS